MQASSISTPAGHLTLLEPLSVPEHAMFLSLAPVLSCVTKRGDGHPVLVVPGFMASDTSTAPLRALLRSKGYDVFGWGLGTNTGPERRLGRGLERRLLDLRDASDRPVSVIGWSLGGLYARELARAVPGAVRQVVTLASPYRSHTGDQPLPVPTTSIYTRTDGVVRWQACVESDGPRRENVAVYGTHFGLAVNPAAIIAITDRLAQPEGTWTRFRPPAAARHLYPDI